MKLLFVCSKNKWRSPTAEAIFAEEPGIDCMSAGLNHDSDNPLTAELVDWADLIFVMVQAEDQTSGKVQRAACRNQSCLSGHPRQISFHGSSADQTPKVEGDALSPPGIHGLSQPALVFMRKSAFSSNPTGASSYIFNSKLTNQKLTEIEIKPASLA